jgi:hypothetical protein
MIAILEGRKLGSDIESPDLAEQRCISRKERKPSFRIIIPLSVIETVNAGVVDGRSIHMVSGWTGLLSSYSDSTQFVMVAVLSIIYVCRIDN